MTIASPSAASLAGLIGGVLGLVLALGIAGAFIVIVVANRADPDSSGRRPYVVYLFGVAFVTVWTALLGSVTVINSLVQLIGGHPDVRSFEIHPIGDASARGVVLGGLVLIVSAATLVVHLRKGRSLVEGDVASPAHRVARSYVSGVAFVSVLIVVFALIVAIYAIFEIAGPGVFGGQGRIPALRTLLDALYLVVAGGAILATHLKMAGPQLWPWRFGATAQAPASPPGSPT